MFSFFGCASALNPSIMFGELTKFKDFNKAQKDRALLYVYYLPSITGEHGSKTLNLANTDSFKETLWEAFASSKQIGNLNIGEYMLIDIPMGKNEIYIGNSISPQKQTTYRATGLSFNAEENQIYCAKVESKSENLASTTSKITLTVFTWGLAKLAYEESAELIMVPLEICTHEISETYFRENQ